MSDKPYLTNDDIYEIADPLKQPAAIVRWFQDQGFIFIVRPNGLPLISRAHFEARMGNTPAPAGNDGTGTSDGPNVVALLNHFQKASHGKKTHQQPARAT